MDKGCFLLHIKDDHLIIENGPVASPPIIRTEEIRIMDEGDLSEGLYKYVITSVGVNGESTYLKEVVVNAMYEYNSIIMTWDILEHITEYHIYRGKASGHYEGYFTIFTHDGYFCDDGRGVLNESHILPPEITPLVISPIRKIHKSSVVCFKGVAIGGIIYMYIHLTTGEEIVLDFSKLVGRPYWTVKYNTSLSIALRSLEEWRCQ